MKPKTLIFSVLFYLMAVACGPKYANLSNAAFAELISNRDSVQLLDVRTPEEFAQTHLPYALNIDVNDTSFITQIGNLDKAKQVAVYCRSGKRSLKAAEILANAGYTVSNLEGGINAWTEDKRQVADANDYIVFDGDQAPDFSTKVYEGGEFSLAAQKGKVVMLQFTASWCGICRREMPFIEKDIWQKHKDNENFVLVAVDLKEGDDGIAKMIEATGITYPVLYDTEAEIFDLFSLHGAGVTRNVLIDKDGKIVMRTRRFHEAEFAELVAKIDELLK